MQIDNKTIFTGVISNANEYYNVMDIFVMPSIHEGLPFVGIEAQTSCLPCLFSDAISKEVGITDNANFYSITKNPNEWAHRILEIKASCSLEKRIEQTNHVKEKLIKAGYDLRTSSEQLENIFDSMLNNKN